MKKNVKTGIVLLFIILVGVLSTVLYCVFISKRAINLVLPNLNEISYVHIDLTKDLALVKLFAYVQNKMPYKMVIDTIYFKVKLNGFKVAEETIPVLINQSRFETDTIELPVHFSLKDIKKIINDIQVQDSTNLDASFYVVYNTFYGKQKFHFNKSTKIATPIPPQLNILKVEYGNYKLIKKTADALIKIEIVNNSKYIDLQLNNIRYNYQINNTLFSKGTFQESIHIKPDSSLTIEIPMVIEFIHPLKTVLKILLDKDKSKYTLNLQSNVIVNTINNNEIPIEVDATGYMELVK